MKNYLFLIALALGAFCPPALADGATVGKPAPALTLKMFDGSTFDLAAQKGKVVLINFWAQWCPPCQAELPALSRFARHHQGDGLAVVEISLDSPHNRESARMLLQQYFLTGGMFDDVTVNGFDEPDSLPTTYIVDAKGIVRAIKREEMTESSLDRIILPLLPTGVDKL